MADKIPPSEFLTPTARAICFQMRGSGDYHAMNQLADALVEGGCEDIALLEPIRSADRVDAQLYVCLLLGGTYSEAVAHIMNEIIALDGLPDHITYRQLMERAAEYKKDPLRNFENDYDGWAEYIDWPAFWKAHEIVTGEAWANSETVFKWNGPWNYVATEENGGQGPWCGC